MIAITVQSPFVQALLNHALTDRIAVRDRLAAWSYRDMVTGAGEVAHALLEGAASGGQRTTLEGERVAVLVEPGATFLQALLGVIFAGGCALVLSPLHADRESSFLLEDARVKTILAAGSPFLARAAALAGQRAVGVAVVDLATLGSRPSRQSGGAPLSESLPRAVAGGGVIAVPAPPRSPALQLYTSGTTGKPKGAVLSHENLATQQTLLAQAWGISPGDELLHVLPLHHMHGLCIALMTALGAGACTRMLPAFDAKTVWDTFSEVTAFMAVPTMYAKLLTAFDEADGVTRVRWAEGARQLRLATSGSAALPVTLAERWRMITGAVPVERFGMTEVGVAFSNPVVGERRPGSVGKALPTVGVRIVGEDGRDVAAGESGELWLAGPSIIAEYFGRPDANADAFVTEGGVRWFRTGDTVERGEDGYVKVLGRTSVDILKTGGYKVSALEFEEVLRDFGPVAEVAVVGVPDELWGDRIVACVVPRPGSEADCDAGAIRDFARTRLATYKVPKTVMRFSELPRTALGKVMKPELVKWVIDGEALPLPE